MTTSAPKRVLVVCYSQTGQLKECADALVAPMRSQGIEVDWVTPKPLKSYPFPWGFSAFVDVFPDCVQGVAPAMEPQSLTAPRPQYDLVIVAYQVWYLEPALPVVAWLKSDAAQVLRNTPVVALCACRNMWQRAFITLKGLITAQGGRVIDHIVREDSGPAWATFWSTPRWMLTGDKVGTGLLPVSGVSPADIASLSGPGSRLAIAVQQGRLQRSVLEGAEASVHRTFVIPELVARTFFGWWSALIIAAGKKHAALKWFTSRVWFFSLCFSVPLIIPAAVVAIFIRLLARRWFQGKVDEVLSTEHTFST